MNQAGATLLAGEMLDHDCTSDKSTTARRNPWGASPGRHPIWQRVGVVKTLQRFPVGPERLIHTHNMEIQDKKPLGRGDCHLTHWHGG